MTFNGHYAVPPTGFFSQPPPLPPFNQPSFQYGIPPPLPHSANAQRFEANSQIPSPPIPYWNPELLKQLSQLPGLPPPPPPPPIPQGFPTPPFARSLSGLLQPEPQNNDAHKLVELHDRAKKAIADLNPYVRYQDFINEGIPESVLDRLYAELNLDRARSPPESARNVIPEVVAESRSAPTPEPPRDSVSEPVIDVGLERKDRIARLLAAKKGRVATGSNSPAQALTPEVVSTFSEPNAAGTPDFTKTPTPDVTAVADEDSFPTVRETTVPSVSNISSPKSTRDIATPADGISNNFSIPGLFMVSDDSLDPATVQTRPKVNTSRLNARMAELKADMLRKKALQDGMPVLNAEVEKTRDRLTEKRNRLAAIREDILTKEHQLSRARDDETRLLEETENLEKQLVEGENGQKQFSRELTKLNDQITEQQRENTSQESITAVISSPILVRKSPITPSFPITAPADDSISKDDDVHSGTSRDTISEASPEDTMETGEDTVMEEAGFATSGHIDAQLSNEAQSTQRTATDTPSNEPSNQEDDDDNDEEMSIDGVSDVESGGSASMSDSGSEYEPAVDQFNVQAQSIEEQASNAPDEYDPNSSTFPVEQSAIENEVENDEYEPSERLDTIDVQNLDQSHQNGDLPMQTIPVAEEQQATDYMPAMASPADDLITTSTFPTRHSSADRIVVTTKTDNKILTQQQNTLSSRRPYEDVSPLDHKPVSNRPYLPYQSPLTMLKSFRFHPQFTELIPNGYRSLTYSNQVDANRPLCAAELEGKMCTDTECEDQHFGAMSLSDDKILVQMSSAFDIKDKAQRDAYLIGLKKVIAGLREKGVKEFSEVAGALSKYRREWQAAQDGMTL